MITNKAVYIWIVFSILLFTSCANAAEPNLDYSVIEEGTFLELSGQPEVISADNCGGETESVQTFRRSKSLRTELDIDISQEVAAEFGGDIKWVRFIPVNSAKQRLLRSQIYKTTQSPA